MGRIAELRKTVQRKTDNIYDTLFTRRVSVYLTAALASTGITANQVSVIGAVVGLGACAFIAFGSPALQLGGVALLHLYAVLDSVDGELARPLEDRPDDLVADRSGAQHGDAQRCPAHRARG